MFDWLGLVGNGLWIVGLAVNLAALSLAHYGARVDGESLWAKLKGERTKVAFGVGTGLFCLGLLLSSSLWWQKTACGLCAVLLVGWTVRSWRRLGPTGKEGR